MMSPWLSIVITVIFLGSVFAAQNFPADRQADSELNTSQSLQADVSESIAAPGEELPPEAQGQAGGDVGSTNGLDITIQSDESIRVELGNIVQGFDEIKGELESLEGTSTGTSTETTAEPGLE